MPVIFVNKRWAERIDRAKKDMYTQGVTDPTYSQALDWIFFKKLPGK